MKSRVMEKLKSIVQKKHFIPISLIIVLGAIIYANSFKNEFVYDDTILVARNIYIKKWNNLFKVFNMDVACVEKNLFKDLFKFKPDSSRKTALFYYRPLQVVSYMFDYSLWRLNVFGYHLGNLLWHLLTAILVYFFVNLISGNLKTAFITGLLFVVNPIHTEAITFISTRTDPMASSFLLLALMLYIKYKQVLSTKKIYYYIGAILSFILALLSKEMAVMFPFILILYDYSLGQTDAPKQKEKILYRYSPFFIISLAYIWFRFHARNLGSFTESGTDLYLRILTTFKSIVLYFKLLILPFNLYMDRTIPAATSILNPDVLVSIVLLLIIGTGVIYAYKNFKIIFFGAFWFLIFFIPTSNILLSLTRSMLEHWMYFPSVGFFMILATGIVKLLEMPSLSKLKYIIISVFSAVIIMYAGLTIKQNRVWKNEFTICRNMLKYYPDNTVAHNNLGNAYASKGMLDEAIKEYKEVLKTLPNSPDVYNNLGNIYASKGMLDEALKEYREALRLNPYFPQVHNSLGAYCAAKGLFDEAIKEYRKALLLDPDYTEVYGNLGVMYESKGMLDKAIKEFNEALRLDPDLPEIHNNLGVIYMKKGILDEAIKEFNEVLKLEPDYPNVHNNLGNIYVSKGMPGEAIKEYKKVQSSSGMYTIPKNMGAVALKGYNDTTKTNPELIEAHINLGDVYKAQGLIEETIMEYKEALKLDSNYVKARTHLAGFYQDKRLFDEAIKEYEKVLLVDSFSAEAHNNLGNVYAVKGHNSQSDINTMKESF
ncbi:MAG: tetratricopeptide repeat protein, partial [bacterium]|nr:tetratricopeptide repeat protein [bacterium]